MQGRTILVAAILLGTSSVQLRQLKGVAQEQSQEEASINVPRGISYRVIKVEYVIEPDIVNSGFNDLGTPKLGKFKVEHRLYEEYKDGELIRSWTEQVKTFVDTLPNQ